MAAPACSSLTRALDDVIDSKRIGVLNADAKTSLASVLAPVAAAASDKPGLLRSSADTDAQLLIVVPFREKVTLHSLRLRSPQADAGPRRLRLYADRPHLSFDDTATAPCAQAVDVSKRDLEQGTDIKLRPAKFTALDSLTLFVETNQGNVDVTEISSLQFFGTVVAGTKVSDIKKKVESTNALVGYLSSMAFQRPPDAPL